MHSKALQANTNVTQLGSPAKKRPTRDGLQLGACVCSARQKYGYISTQRCTEIYRFIFGTWCASARTVHTVQRLGPAPNPRSSPPTTHAGQLARPALMIVRRLPPTNAVCALTLPLGRPRKPARKRSFRRPAGRQLAGNWPAKNAGKLAPVASSGGFGVETGLAGRSEIEQ